MIFLPCPRCFLTPQTAFAAGYTWVKDIYLSQGNEYACLLSIWHMLTEEEYRLGEVADVTNITAWYGLYAPLRQPLAEKKE